MRVISGEFRGRRLVAVPGQNTRPTTDKVKESMFNIIGPYFEGGTALDLFAGTGGLGIESLSRGIQQAVFIEADFKAFNVVRENIRTLGLGKDRAEVYKNDARRALDTLATRGMKFDLVFLDPPYKLTGFYEELIVKMLDLNLFEPRAYVIAEHAADVHLPDRYGNLVRWRQVSYGEISISFYELSEGTEVGEGDAEQDEDRDLSGLV
ncbi:16S rRNA (guanine(966)-N(2))-methyltransferase RsmD [Tumebacillus permanentifrigoris]|uniref:16S rRNA (Guanine(966)-N(2))-methyltransferase RsmD n=1 Tax=Tumebacillus permanentifrigoris TaxID=378543 RepID=A0A316DA25_9BACL|nr:16S rRNA (guanine(966)-N(2))-methyltransferase RsmD [Tumebacillus permanentifrigoris]PWK12781.1 16S rRNA (guanine(966)-N(2))-methyltransferase RsmD [Tumebacillus permanentifrigoris]